MGKILSVIIGGIVVLVGLILFVRWWHAFVFVAKGMVPAIMVFGGIVALAAGLSELRDSAKQKK